MWLRNREIFVRLRLRLLNLKMFKMNPTLPQKSIKYQFKILNLKTGKVLWSLSRSISDSNQNGSKSQIPIPQL